MIIRVITLEFFLELTSLYPMCELQSRLKFMGSRWHIPNDVEEMAHKWTHYDVATVCRISRLREIILSVWHLFLWNSLSVTAYLYLSLFVSSFSCLFLFSLLTCLHFFLTLGLSFFYIFLSFFPFLVFVSFMLLYFLAFLFHVFLSSPFKIAFVSVFIFVCFLFCFLLLLYF